MKKVLIAMVACLFAVSAMAVDAKPAEVKKDAKPAAISVQSLTAP